MILKLTVPRKGRVRVRAEEGGELLKQDEFSPGNAKDRRRVEREFKLDKDTLLKPADSLDDDKSKSVSIEVKETEEKFVITRRMMNATEGVEFSGATVTEALSLALAGDTGDLLSWHGTESLCLLDVDYHGEKKPPSVDEWDVLIPRIRPQPVMHWLSKGGGLHAAYARTDVFLASELAAAAGLSYCRIDPTATFDLVSQVRVPKGEVKRGGGDVTVSLMQWVEDVDPSEVQKYLEANDLSIGSRYPDSRCPINPSASDLREPVWVLEDGIKCFRCSAKGSGFFPWRRLVDRPAPGALETLVSNFTHWEHAKTILGTWFSVSDEILRLAYSAWLKAKHGEDERVGRVFYAGDNVVRINDSWFTRDAIGSWQAGKIAPMLAELPACQNQDGKPLASQIARFSNPVNLRDYGYPNLTPIRGIKIYGHRLPYKGDEKFPLVVPNEELAGPYGERFRPRYVPLSQRMSLDDAWRLVESVFTGVDRNYLKLLIAAKGLSESLTSLPPLIFVAGVSMAGKTQTAHLAAAMCGDTAGEVHYLGNMERFKQAIASESQKGSFVLADEIFKNGVKRRGDAVNVLDTFLNVTENSVTHELYKGPSRLGRVPVCVCTDIAVPQEIRSDKQVARRFVYVYLNDSHPDWFDNCKAHGMGAIKHFRTWQEGRGAAAADAIISEVIDNFFDTERTMENVAGSLDFPILYNAKDFDDPKQMLRDFWNLWVDEQKLHPGEVRIKRNDESMLGQAWAAICDNPDTDEWYDSRKARAEDWKGLTGRSVRFVLKRKRGEVVLNFKET